MSFAKLSDRVRARNWRAYRDALAIAGILLAVTLLGTWVLLAEPGPASPGGTPSSRATPRAVTFTPHAAPRSIADVAFQDAAGATRSLADFRSRVVLVNVWATWCPPCRAEMPTLDRLQAHLGGPDFEVVALSIDRGGQDAVKAFYDEINVRALAVYVDATAEAQDKLGIVGVPTTLLIDREGREVARYIGPAEWDRPEVIAIIHRYLPPQKP